MKIRTRHKLRSGQKVKARLKFLSKGRKALAAREPLPSSPRTVVKVNISGNRRGMHNRDNPPTSEHMSKIRAMRKFYNKQMPVLQCASCSFASSCPKFKSGYECAFLPFLNAHRINNEHDLIESMQELCSTGMRRAHLQTIMETLTGAPPSLEVSESLNLVFTQLKALHEVTGGGNVGVTIETADESIIGKLFGGLDKLIEHTSDARDNPLDVPIMKQLNDSGEKDPILETFTNPNVNMDLVRAHARAEVGAEKGDSRQAELTVTELTK